MQLVVTATLSEKGRPLTKILAGNFGGMIFQLEIIHPHHHLYNWKSLVKLPKDKTLNRNEANTLDVQNMIRNAARGPDLKLSPLIYPTLEDYPFAGEGKSSPLLLSTYRD
jgi:hypothetical protein